MSRHHRVVILAMVVGLLTLHVPLAVAFSADDFNDYTVARLTDETSNQPRLGGFVTTDNTWHSCYRTETGIVRAVKTSDGGMSQTNTTIVSDNAGIDLQPCTMDSWNDGQDLVMAFVDEITEFEERISIAISDDAGSSWTVTRDILSCDGTRRCTTPFIGTFSSTNWNILFRAENATGGFDVNLTTSTDGGSTWSGETVAELQGGSIDVHYLDKDHWYIAECQGACAVSRTDDGGTTWTKGNNTFDSGTDALALWAESTEVIWTITLDSTFSDGIRVHRSPDAGDSWNQRLHRENRDSDVDVITPTDTNLTYIVYGEHNNDNDFHIERSDDDGATWTTIEIDANHATAGDGLQSFPILSEGDEEKILIYASSRVSGAAPSDSIIEAWSQKIPGQPPINSASLFGNAQDVGVIWDGTPFIYVKDIATADRIYKINSGLSIVSNRDVCGGASVTQADDVWFNEGSSDTFTIEDGQTILGLAVNRNATAPILHDCAVSGPFDGATVARTDTMAYVDILPYLSGSFTDQLYMQASDAFDARNAIYADVSGAQTTNGLYLMTSGFSDFFHSSELGPSPFENLKDVAVDKEVGLNTRTFCVTSSSNGTRCYNQNGGLRAANTTLDADLIEVFNNEILTHNSTETAKWIIQGSDFVKQATIASTDNFAEWQVSRDGRYLHAVGSTSSADYVLYDVANWTEISRLSSPFLDAPRSVSSDASNNHAYVVDQTTIYQIEVFNFTTSDEGAGVIGEPNPTTDLDSDEEPTGGTTQDEEGKIAGLAASLNIPTFAMKHIFATVLLFFGGVAGTVFMGAKRGPWVGAGAGFLLGVGFQLYDAWVLVTVVIIAAAVIAKEGL